MKHFRHHSLRNVGHIYNALFYLVYQVFLRLKLKKWSKGVDTTQNMILKILVSYDVTVLFLFRELNLFIYFYPAQLHLEQNVLEPSSTHKVNQLKKKSLFPLNDFVE